MWRSLDGGSCSPVGHASLDMIGSHAVIRHYSLLQPSCLSKEHLPNNLQLNCCLVQVGLISAVVRIYGMPGPRPHVQAVIIQSSLPPLKTRQSGRVLSYLVYSRREIFCLMSVAGYRSALPSAVARFHHFIRSFSLGTRPRIRAFTTSRVSLAAMAELQQREELTGRLLDGKLIARYVAGCLDCFQMPGSL